MDITEEINFDSKNWKSDLLSLKEKEGKLHPETGVDYFVFKKATLTSMPPFAIGRTTWDNWIISSFLKAGIPVIDGTEIITIHQNHDFTHIKSKKGRSYVSGLVGSICPNPLHCKLQRKKRIHAVGTPV